MGASLDRMTYELEAKTWLPSKKLIIQLAGLPKNQRCRHILVEVEATVTDVGAASEAVIAPAQVCDVFATVWLKAPLYDLRATGHLLWILYRAMRGKTINNKMVTIPMDTSKTVRTAIIIPFADPRAVKPNDTAMPTELLEGKTIEIQTAATGDIDAQDTGVQSVTAATIYTSMFFLPGNSDEGDAALPTAQLIDYEDWNQQTALLKHGGAYSHMFVYDESDWLLTLAEYERMRLQLDGREVVDRLRSIQLVMDYNDCVALGSGFPSASDSSLPEGASEDTEQLDLTNLAFLPLLSPPEKYMMAQLPIAEKTARADITGTTTAARFAYRLLRSDISTSELQEAAGLMGIADPERASFEPKTSGKTDLQGDPDRVALLERLLPKRILEG